MQTKPVFLVTMAQLSHPYGNCQIAEIVHDQLFANLYQAFHRNSP